MAEATDLDHAFQAMLAAPEDMQAAMAAYSALADAQLWLLLEGEAQDDQISPHLFETEDGAFTVVFDREERLAGFVSEIAAHAVLPGRVLIRMLAGQGLGLAVNLGSDAEMVFAPAQLEWLADILEIAPESGEALPPQELRAPRDIPEPFLTALDARLARASGLARAAFLAQALYADGSTRHILAVIDAVPEAETALAGAIADAVRFYGDGAPDLDVAFFTTDDPIAQHLAVVGLRFDLPEPPQPEERPARPAPGSDPDSPPILR
ncbi:MAG: SseB family protein [Mangrovicoccus sp.]|nr:SseB family protein [Mangrovicoccus sp.]